jgi:hypothetical protein
MVRGTVMRPERGSSSTASQVLPNWPTGTLAVRIVRPPVMVVPLPCETAVPPRTIWMVALERLERLLLLAA